MAGLDYIFDLADKYQVVMISAWRKNDAEESVYKITLPNESLYLTRLQLRDMITVVLLEKFLRENPKIEAEE